MNNYFKSFIRDKIFITVIFFLNSFFLILFYHLSQSNDFDIIYPLLITFLMYMIYLIVEWISYFQFNKSLNNCIENLNHELVISNRQQEKISEVINKIHQKYIKTIHKMKINNREQKRFLSQLIHNIKTPISVIDLILQEYSSSQSQALSEIKAEKVRLYNLLENVLSILRLDDFSQDYITEKVDLKEEIKRLINKRKKQFIYHNVYPKLNVKCGNTFVITDSKWNQVMLDQFISNAIKYSSVKKESQELTFIINSKSNKVELKIIDQGIGIPDYDLEKVFEPFFTGKNGRTHNNSTGIGLYICSRIAKKLGHELSLNSEINSGTEIKVTYLT